jgi:hypothetical protein
MRVPGRHTAHGAVALAPTVAFTENRRSRPPHTTARARASQPNRHRERRLSLALVGDDREDALPVGKEVGMDRASGSWNNAFAAPIWTVAPSYHGDGQDGPASTARYTSSKPVPGTCADNDNVPRSAQMLTGCRSPSSCLAFPARISARSLAMHPGT